VRLLICGFWTRVPGSSPPASRFGNTLPTHHGGRFNRFNHAGVRHPILYSCSASNVALQLRAAAMVTLAVSPFPLQSPPQPANVSPLAASAVSVTTVPRVAERAATGRPTDAARTALMSHAENSETAVPSQVLSVTASRKNFATVCRRMKNFPGGSCAERHR